MRKTIIDQKAVEQAVEILKSESQPITISAISKLTGYTYTQLYYSCKQYRRPYNSNKSRKVYTKIDPRHFPKPESFKPTTEIEKSLNSYKDYIKENYFHTPEKISNAFASMSEEIIGFDQGLFKQAVNILEVEGIIAESKTMPGYYLVKPVVEDRVQYIVVMDDTVRFCIGAKAADEEAVNLLKKNLDGKVSIFRAVKDVSAEIRLTTTYQ